MILNGRLRLCNDCVPGRVLCGRRAVVVRCFGGCLTSRSGSDVMDGLSLLMACQAE